MAPVSSTSARFGDCQFGGVREKQGLYFCKPRVLGPNYYLSKDRGKCLKRQEVYRQLPILPMVSGMRNMTAEAKYNGSVKNNRNQGNRNY